jgi:hypothetical protein
MSAEELIAEIQALSNDHYGLAKEIHELTKQEKAKGASRKDKMVVKALREGKQAAQKTIEAKINFLR